MASVLQVNEIKDSGGNATGITVADSSANVTIGNLTATTASIPAAAGSSMVLIKTITTSDGDSSISLINGSNGVVIDSTYTNYKLVVSGIVPTTNDRNILFQVGSSGGLDSNCFGGSRHYYDNGTSRGGQDYNINRTYLYNTYMGLHNGKEEGGLSGTFTLYNVANSNYATHCLFEVMFYAVDAFFYGGNGATTTVNQYTVDRISITATNSSTFKGGGKISLYGLKDA